MRFQMSDQKKIRRLLIPMAILALVITSTLGMAWHRHANFSSSDTCPICHLGHQAIASPTMGIDACTVNLTSTGPEPQYVSFVSSSVCQLIPVRAPPA
jgi:hypothetical protein